MDVPRAQGGASLLISWRCEQKRVLVVGTGHVAASRVLTALEADALVTLYGPRQYLCHELTVRVERGEVEYMDTWYDDSRLASFDLVFSCHHDESLSETIAADCRRLRVPINTADRPTLCDFYMTSTYRDQSLQVAVSTICEASKLANRVKRHIATSLPANLGEAIGRVGSLRRRLRQEDSGDEAVARRMKWLAQICEYWSLDQLAKLDDIAIEQLLKGYREDDEGYHSMQSFLEPLPPSELVSTLASSAIIPSSHTPPTSISPQPGKIILCGSGPGDPSYLTMAAYDAITKEADLVLADKIVPQEILQLVKCELRIARKFPGNTERAQNEFNRMALEAANQGKTVLRLKQGDPYLFGRGAEEVLFFRQHGYEPIVLAGLTSAMAAPLLAGISVTHRNTASQCLITTATGKQGSRIALPQYSSTRTDIFLMSIHRLNDLVQELTEQHSYPPDIPTAIIERAGCVDQRCIWAPLNGIVQELERCGGSLPPGLLVVGWSVGVLRPVDLPVSGVGATMGAVNPSRRENISNTLPKAVPDQLLGLHDPHGLW
ncbi:hypothetical protein BZG36_01318 [Bifiguratus adelaidae]|uniref:precorrin-2 dehydrogenase n=1 Tax=Bifiguratus adelaidae TaxID=1938954 RepID=A0A261Y528_9FUNG|nr:hypothetical protein BZG36_01318 [Bifiguratus adelaidae]